MKINREKVYNTVKKEMDKKVELMFKQDVSHIEEKINRKLSEKEKSELRKTYENPSVPNDASDALTYTVRVWYQNVENMQNFNILKMNRMKLPLIEDLIRKEKTMKKKIKDLTEEEIENQGFMLMLHQMGKGDENGITPCKVIHFGKSVNDFLNTEVDIPQPHILDKKEHDYLRAVIKPYKVNYIKKTETGYDNYFIGIVVKSSVYCGLTAELSMPYFTKGSMYKGMETNRKYTIEDLELDKEWEE